MASVGGVSWDEPAFEAVARDLLGAFPSVRMRVSGTCMEPALKEGATVVLASVERARPRFGDVVLARHPEGLRLHRLVWAPGRAPGSWRTQADRALLFDARLRAKDVLATVVKVEGSPASPRRMRRAATSLLCSLLHALRLRLGLARG